MAIATPLDDGQMGRQLRARKWKPSYRDLHSLLLSDVALRDGKVAVETGMLKIPAT